MRLSAGLAILILAAAPVVAAEQTPSTTQKARPDRSSDEAALMTVNTAFEEAVAKADFKAAAALWTADGAYTGLDGQRRTGPADIADALSGALNDLKLTLQNTSVHFVKPDVAIAAGTWRVSGPSAPDVDHGEFIAVLTKGPGGWRYADVRAFVPTRM